MLLSSWSFPCSPVTHSFQFLDLSQRIIERKELSSSFVLPPHCANKEIDGAGVLYGLVSRSRSYISFLSPVQHFPLPRLRHRAPTFCLASGLSFKEFSTLVRVYIRALAGTGEIHSHITQAALTHLSINHSFYL